MNKLQLIIVGMALLGAVGQLAFKKGSELLRFTDLLSFANKWLVLGLILYGSATIGYIIALKGLNLSQAYPFIALSYLFVMLLSLIFLGEKVTAVNICGSLLLLLAVFMMVI